MATSTDPEQVARLMEAMASRGGAEAVEDKSADLNSEKNIVRYPRIRGYAPVWSEDGSKHPDHYRRIHDNDFMADRIITPDYTTWKGPWDEIVEINEEEDEQEGGYGWRMAHGVPPGYLSVIFLDAENPDPNDANRVIYETFLPTAPSTGHMFCNEGKFYMITDVTYMVHTDEFYNSPAEIYLMVELAFIGDAQKLLDERAAEQRRKGFVVHTNEKPGGEDESA